MNNHHIGGAFNGNSYFTFLIRRFSSDSGARQVAQFGGVVCPLRDVVAPDRSPVEPGRLSRFEQPARLAGSFCGLFLAVVAVVGAGCLDRLLPGEQLFLSCGFYGSGKAGLASS